MAFMTSITTSVSGEPQLNFANQEHGCSSFPGTDLPRCPDIEADIEKCQRVYGKKILLSIGGATFSQMGFPTAQGAVAGAHLVFNTFGPVPKQAETTSNGTTSHLSTNVTMGHLSTDGATGRQGTSGALRRPSPNGTTNHLSSNETLHRVSSNRTASRFVKSSTPEVIEKNGLTTPGRTREALNPTPVHFPGLPSLQESTTLHGQRPLQAREMHRRQTEQPLRPFGDAVIDGFDFDFEAPFPNAVAFARELRSLMDADGNKPFYLTTAPQCPYPDASLGDLLSSDVHVDAVFVQFYNNYCGLQSFKPNASTQQTFNFDVWDKWASPRKTKVFLGVPAGPSAAGTGYQDPAQLKPIIEFSKRFSSFGGVMMWDASQAYANRGLIADVRSSLRKPLVRRRGVSRS